MTDRMTRREMLRWSGLLGASALLAACAPAGAPATPAPPAPTATSQAPPVPTGTPPPPSPITVTVMCPGNELPEQAVQQFNAEYAPTTIHRIDADRAAPLASLAAGNPPDIMRTRAPDIPQFLAHNVMRNLQPLFEASDVLKEDDLLDVNNYYRANSPVDVGSGPRYGMAKDWTPDGFLWVNEMAFEMAGTTPPAPDIMPITSIDLMQWARTATEMEGDRAIIMGFNTDTGLIDRYWMNLAKMGGGSLFSDDFEHATMVGNWAVVDAIRLFYDMMDEGIMSSPLHPFTDGYAAAFANAQLAMVYTGYGFGSQIKALAGAANAGQEARDGLAQDRWKMYPMFTYKGVRSNPCLTATGAIIVNPDLKTTAPANPDAAWTAFEWFMGREPARNRAASGWGLPALRSLLPLVPQETDFDKQTYATVQAELAYAGDTIAFNPYLEAGKPMVPGQIFLNSLESMLRGEREFDDVLAQMESATNAAIQRGIDDYGKL